MWRSRKHKSWAKLILDERIYYACCVIAGGKEEFFLWFSGEPDGVLLSGEFVLTFRDFNALAEYCTQADLQLADEATSRYDIDAIDAWICTPHDAEFDVDMLLNAWNMMDDFYLAPIVY